MSARGAGPAAAVTLALTVNGRRTAWVTAGAQAMPLLVVVAARDSNPEPAG